MGQPLDPTNAPLSPILAQMIAKHGPMLGRGYALDPMVDDPSGAPGLKTQNPDPTYRYTFADGSTLDGTWDGGIKNMQEADPSKASTVKTATAYDGSVWERKDDGSWGQVVGGDPTKGPNSPGARLDEAKLDEILANRDAGRGLMTTEQWHKLQTDLAAGRLRQDEFEQKKHEFEQTNQRAIEQEARLNRKTNADIGLIGAQTAGAGIENQMNQERLRQLIATAPSAERKAQLEAELADLQTQQARKALTGPGIVTTPTGPYITTQVPGEAPRQSMALGYVPKTQAEVAARVGQIQAAANAKKAEVMGKVGANYTADQALSEFNSWWDQNVESQLGGLQAAQVEAAQARATAEDERRRNAMATAQQVGQTAVQAYQAGAGRRVGPGMGEAMAQAAQGKFGDWSNAVTYQGRDPNEIAQQATMDALKYISPAAAQATGTQPPNYAQMDIAGMLNRTNYQPFGGGAAPAPAGGGGVAPLPGGGGAPLPAAGAAPNLFHATNIITTPDQQNPWSYNWIPPDYQLAG